MFINLYLLIKVIVIDLLAILRKKIHINIQPALIIKFLFQISPILVLNILNERIKKNVFD